MSKLSSFKKGIIYALATLLVIPTWLAIDMGGAEDVQAADSSEEISHGDVGYSEKTPANWTTTSVPGAEGRWTSVPDESASWEFAPTVTGEYQVYVNWVIHSNQTNVANYHLTDDSVLDTSAVVNQELDADGSTKVNGTISEYKNLGTFDFTQGQSYQVEIDGVISAGNNLFAGVVKIVHNNVVPSTPVLIGPTDGALSRSGDINFDWGDVIDQDGDSISYDFDFVGHPAIDGITNSYLNVSGLSNGHHGWRVRSYDGYDYSTWSEAIEIVVDKNGPTIPSNLTASLMQSEVTLNWNASTDAITSVAGYDIYRAASPVQKINSSLVTGTSYVDKLATVGTYTYYVIAVDEAGNESCPSNSVVVNVAYTAPTAPDVSVTVVGKEITISWKGVGGGVEKYTVYVGGIPQTPVSVSGDDTGVGYLTKVTVGSYGNYEVYVKATGIGGITDSSKAVISVSAPVVVSNVPHVASTFATVVRETVSVADNGNVEEDTNTEDVVAEEENLDEDGKIKGEEEEATEDDDINWTPWIILFILIILAGAATGGYFYWFADEEEVKTKVREDKNPVESPAPKKSDKSKGSSKRRW